MRTGITVAGVSLFFATLMGAGAAPSTPLRVLPLGDSITDGYNVPGGYRAPLYQLLTNAGYRVDFVGTQTANGAATLPEPQHEGHSGWLIHQIDALLPGLCNQIAGPDIVLLLIGTNDYGLQYDIARAAERLEALIAKLAVCRPHARIIVANLLERAEPRNTEIQTTFNPQVPIIVERQAALGRLVSFTDLRSAVPLADMPDQLHPNLAGYQKMATNWFNAITNAVPLTFNSDVMLMPEDAACRWLAPTNDNLGLSWTTPAFDDDAWTSGVAPLGYQAPVGLYSNVIRTFTTADIAGLYGRWKFVVPDSDSPGLGTLTLRMRYDDGFVAFINGVPAAQTNAPVSASFDSLATATHVGTSAMTYVAFALDAQLVQRGTNLLAIHVLNRTTGGPVRGLLVGPELRAGLLPPAAIQQLQFVTNRAAALDLRGPPDTAWSLDAADAPGAWTTLSVFEAKHSAWRMEDASASSAARRFYRIVHQPSGSAQAGDYLQTSNGPVLIHPVYHGSLALIGGGQTIYVDPSTNRFAGLPPADLILYTHTHGDHFSSAALPGLLASNTVVVAPPAVYAALAPALQAITTVLTNGGSTALLSVAIEAVPMYNTGANPAHPPGVGNGYVLTLGGKRIYVSGDSSDTPEMRALPNIDVAFVNMLAPWMTPTSAAAAIRAFAPRVVYPCHAWGTDVEACRQAIGSDLPIEVRLRQWH